MAKGNNIILTVAPQGVRLEGYVNAALKPGTVVQIDASEGIGDDGRNDWEAYNNTGGENGKRGMIGILLEDSLQGALASTAYTSGARCTVYIPRPGEEFNMLLTDISGTADDHAIGEALMVGDGTGTLLASAGSPESEPFMLMETVTDPVADTLAHCIFTGY